ncbi:MAG: PilZ domain-containing protein [Nitrospiraceae bacterium]|nr:MAG: PilZ domain-containing protein [Nitrospiraceae bacterium]
MRNSGARQKNTFASDDTRKNCHRSVFTYPVKFKVFRKTSGHSSFNGYLRDISIDGASLEFEDKYGRFSLKEANKSSIKISFSIPHEGKVNIFARIKWVKKSGSNGNCLSIGIEFKDMESWQLDTIEKLIGMKNKDHNMMWNLWEQYEK